MKTPGYHLGCPVWACDAWVGSLYTTTQRRKWLLEYSSVFSTVEGNSTFYGQPSPDTVRRWASETAPGFRFALKFPRTITHERLLIDAADETRLFIETLQILRELDRLGPSILQLPPWFDGRKFDDLACYLRGLPRELPVAVEVRHLDYFHHGHFEDQLTELLVELGMERVIFDSRALFSAPPTDKFEEASQQRKPNLPVRPIALGNQPLVRFVGRNRIDEVEPWIEAWVPVVAEWMQRGKTPYVFTHAPNDAFAPEFAVRFHAALQQVCPRLVDLPDWPGHQLKRQKSLF